MGKICIYCGVRPGRTRDHIPPRCFFPPTCPPNIQRITVPCCETCRVGQDEDGFVRNLLISCAITEAHPTVLGGLADARNRSFDKDHTQVSVVIPQILKAEVHSVASEKLGTAPVLNFDHPAFDRFFHRLVRGLLHVEKKSGFVPSTIKWRANVPPDIARDFGASPIGRTVSDEFAYSALFLEDSLQSIWLLTFYGKLQFFVALIPSSNE